MSRQRGLRPDPRPAGRHPRDRALVDQRGRLVRRRPRRRLAGPDRAGRGARGGARRAHGRLPHRGRGPRGPEDRARRRRLRASPGWRADRRWTPTRSPRSPTGSATPFADPGLLARALTHRSWCAEHAGYESNERLEFLGDAVLGLVVTDHVFRHAPRPARGRAGQGAGVGGERRRRWPRSPPSSSSATVLRLGKGEDASGGREKPSILADAMEAVIGAVYLDGGLAAARDLVLRPARRAHRRSRPPRPRRPRLQDPAPGAGRPRVRALPATTCATRAPTTTKLLLRRRPGRRRGRGRGEGRSKKAAEQAAAPPGVRGAVASTRRARLAALPGTDEPSHRRPARLNLHPRRSRGAAPDA